MAERPPRRGRGSTPGRRPAPRPRADPARLAALRVLVAVRADKAYANLALPAVLADLGLSGRDAAFATELAAGTIRLRGRYDAVLDTCIDRPLRKVESKVLDIARLGCHQLLAMRVPDHAAISATVDLARAAVGPGAGGFVNAVLRRVAADDLDGWLARIGPAPGATSDAQLAVVHSHPAWVVAELRQALAATGADAELPDLLAADNRSPAVTLVARPGASTRDELSGEPTPLSPYGVRLAAGAPGDLPAVAEGRAGVQDEGSQLVAHALAIAPLEGPDRLWLDLCAGPGGKAALGSALAAERGATLVAGELQPHRALLVRRGLRAVPGARGVVVADGLRAPFRPGSFDRVLVDAPCTGLGALRRRPEARWARRPDDLLSLVMTQRALVTSALRLVRPGGVVVYATCSPVLAETAEVVTAVLGQHPEAELGDAGALLTDAPDRAGPLPFTVQLWPHRHGTDAMFIALVRRRP